MHPGPGGAGLSRKAIMEQVDASLAWLGDDHMDLYQIHRFDPDVPVEETKHYTIWSRPARPATLAPPRCGPGSSPNSSTLPQYHCTPFVSMQDQDNLETQAPLLQVPAARADEHGRRLRVPPRTGVRSRR